MSRYKLSKNANADLSLNINCVRTPTQNYESLNYVGIPTQNWESLNYVRTPTENYESI